MMDGQSASRPPSLKTAVLIDLWHLGSEAPNSRFVGSLLGVVELIRTKDLSGKGYFMCCRTPGHERKGEEQVETALKDLRCGDVVGAESFAAALYAVKQKLDENGVEKVTILLSWERKSLMRKYMEQLFTGLYRFELIELPMCVKEQLLKKSLESRSEAGPRRDPEVERIQKEISQFLESLPSLKGDFTILKSSLIPVLSGRDPPAVVKENLRRLSHAAGFNPEMYHSIKVNHATDVWVMGQPQPESYDGIVTNQRDVTITAPGADCIPVLFADPVKKVCGAAHSESKRKEFEEVKISTFTSETHGTLAGSFEAMLTSGWQGTLLGVSMAVVNAMVTAYGSDVKDILVVLGPSVGPCCFMLPKQSAEEFYKIDPTCVRCFESSNPYVDIRRATRVLLEAGGILPINIQDDSVTDPEQNLTLCTSCHPDKFYSHVRDGENFGTQIGFISIKN